MATIFTTKSPLDISFAVCVNGRWQTVKFIPAAMYGVKSESLFVADDELAEAMKRHHWFGVNFFVKEEVEETNGAVAEEAVKTIEDELTDPENAIIVESVTTKGMAVAYIQGMYGESFTATTVEDMKREAAQKWNVIFPKWGK
jgi:hypothetical protein